MSAIELPKRDNNFGFFRLFFATLVILSHAPELVDGNRSRELCTQIFGTLSFGEIGVDGFFLLSGYLITQSFVNRRSTSAYLSKRVLRIVPGYMVSFWLCVLVIYPWVSFQPVAFTTLLTTQVPRAMLLLEPNIVNGFAGVPRPQLNGALWTIAFEFTCYGLTLLLGLLGFYAPRYRCVLPVMAMLMLGLNAMQVAKNSHLLPGTLENFIRLAGVYWTGASYYLWRERIILHGKYALGAACLLLGLLFNHWLAEAAWAILGGYILFWAALKLPVWRLSRFANRFDISYGLYLYAWPVQDMLIWADHSISPWVLFPVSLLCAGLLGGCSWLLIEQPALRLASHDR